MRVAGFFRLRFSPLCLLVQKCQNFISGDFTKGSLTKIFAEFGNNCLIGANSIFFWNWPDDTPNNICLLLKNS
jgi:hypothetical protein